MKRYAFAAVAALALGGCSMGEDLSSGGTAVDVFHRQYDGAQFAAIDAAAGAEIKATPGGLAPILERIHARLGNVKSSNRTGFNDRVDNGDHRLELTYDTTFEKGAGDEEFVFRMTDGKPVLIGYHVKSDALKGGY
ncbi:MAG: hypothetical protein J0J06_07075 [Sphingomonas sp.]|uniref:hypothetical protein n=1 Tax=Sphingomonas sp. TaxID=28214 RepID=UPI001ACE03A3|nr:hypothetical protein [Sphingomonas sp.]MBN8815193.1 hypothetical protein [Sphingomonas sp.]